MEPLRAPPPRRIRVADVVRFGLVMAALGAAVDWSYRHPRLYGPLSALEGWTTDATGWLLAWTGIDVERAGTVLSHPAGFAYAIGYRCTGLVVAAFLVAGLLALPLGWRARARGLAAGVPLVLAVNQARLVSLYFVGVHRPEAFDFAHLVAWEAAMAAVVLGVWVGCAARRGPAAAGPIPRPAHGPRRAGRSGAPGLA